MDGDYVQTVVEILPECAVGDFFFQIGVGQCKKTDIQFDGFGAANPGNLLLLDGPEQFYLEIHWHIADLIQHKCAVVGQLDRPGFPLELAPEKAPFS